ncbi:MAG: hypothetical protein R3B70_06560 [Polyangiaceae bacterium]
MRLSSSIFWAAPAAVLAASLATGCGAADKASEKAAADRIPGLVTLVKDDVAQVRKGLPEGAEKLGKLVGPDVGNDLVALQRSIASARAGVKDLELAKSTFFTFVDTTGTSLRSEADPDLLATHNVFAALPELKKSVEPNSKVVEAFGDLKEVHIRAGNDFTWAAAAPVKDDKGDVKGAFVTGWTLRGLAYHLEEMTKREVLEAAKQAGSKSVPVVYVFVLHGKKAYGAGQTPEVNTKAVEDLDLLTKAAGGPVRGLVEITGRTFGYAAARTTDEYAPDTGVAVLASEI